MPVVAVIERDGLGELVYSGGDDTLALTTTAVALVRAAELAERFRAAVPGSTLSGGIAVAHYKEDLRFVLQEAREAERAAKRCGRDALALRICRRSGEHAEVVVSWNAARAVDALVACFADPTNNVSDRWAYALRADLPVLSGLPVPAVRAEVGRRVDRVDGLSAGDRNTFRQGVLELFDGHLADQIGRGACEADAVAGFVTLCQSASFLARGGDRQS